jgi:hypothetical protein
MSYRNLEDLTNLLKSFGFVSVRMDKAWKRRDHREVLVSGWFPVTDRKADVAKIEEFLKAHAEEFHFNINRLPLFCKAGDKFVQLDLLGAKVALP